MKAKRLRQWWIDITFMNIVMIWILWGSSMCQNCWQSCWSIISIDQTHKIILMNSHEYQSKFYSIQFNSHKQKRKPRTVIDKNQLGNHIRMCDRRLFRLVIATWPNVMTFPINVSHRYFLFDDWVMLLNSLVNDCPCVWLIDTRHARAHVLLQPLNPQCIRQKKSNNNNRKPKQIQLYDTAWHWLIRLELWFELNNNNL